MPRAKVGNLINGEPSTKHPLYPRWKEGRARCRYRNHVRYAYYGGAGIKWCRQWNDFAMFVADMEPTYEEGLWLCRKNPAGNYTPSNCYWGTKSQAIHNRRKNRHPTVGIVQKGRRFRARVKVGGKTYLDDSYEDMLQAMRARNKVVTKLFGEAAVLNFPIRKEAG
jgi:hypothetical protein